MDSKFGAELADISCRNVQVGTVTLPDGTVQPVFEPKARVPKAYRRLIDIVTNEGHYSRDR